VGLIYTKFHKVISQSLTKLFYNKNYFVRLCVVLCDTLWQIEFVS